LVPYLMSSHPGSTLRDAVILAEYLYDNNVRPEQVQDFYPTPGTVSTCMFYTELDPYTLQKVFVAKTPEEKAMQRALLQYYEPRNAQRVRQALQLVHREDLIPKLVQGGAARAADSRNSAVQREKGARRASFASDEKAAALTPAATARTAKKAAAGGARKGTSAWPTPTNTTRRIQSSRKNVRSKKD
ncbi:MAG: DUF3362 domain-containing protein, partial [Ruthenibacterium sp.]